MPKYIPTGNEMVSLPTIRESDGGIESISFLYMRQKGMVELRGGRALPLMQPFLQKKTDSGFFEELPLSEPAWQRDCWWIPVFQAQAGGLQCKAVYLSPVGERGFGVRLTLRGQDDASVRFGLKGCWQGAWHCINEDKQIEGSLHCYKSGWNDSLIFDMRNGFSLFAFAPIAEQAMESSFAADDEGVSYELAHSCELRAGQEASFTIWWGLGFEEVAAATSAKEMLRRGWEWEYDKTRKWLLKRSHPMTNTKLTALYNTNLFFCLFFSTGITLDTEELVCVTSRSSRYYVSAAYWDRDTLLWSFPAILDADAELARQILFYVFGRQCRNLGIHSRYIDGTVLEPGLELDELVAPVIALFNYVNVTGDKTILSSTNIDDGIKRILKSLAALKHPDAELFETFLQPTDDEHVYPYLSYDNMLVWLALTGLSQLYPDEKASFAEQAAKVKEAIYNHCVFSDEKGKKYFAWSVDLQGHHDVYDEPPGSQQLYPYYSFCSSDDEIWQNTVRKIRSPDYRYSFADHPISEIGCPHAPYPWVLSICNSLLSGHAREAWLELEALEMDNGIACESVDPITGTCMTGAAFATCAGFLCHSMKTAFKGELP